MIAIEIKTKYNKGIRFFCVNEKGEPTIVRNFLVKSTRGKTIFFEFFYHSF